MIIKKPYAFLIKKFRLLHAILFALILFSIIKTYNIYAFFNHYVTQHFYVKSFSLASDYISVLLYFVSIIIILFTLVIFYLLSLKKKDRKIYFIIPIFYIVYIILLIIFSKTFVNLSKDLTLSIENSRVMRDISLIIFIIQCGFGLLMLLRALGFNVKQFDFKKDLIELDIDSSDYEEVEITLGKNNYKTKRNIRKTLRLLKYFILENKIFIITVCSIIVVIGLLFIYKNFRQYTTNYYQEQVLIANNIQYTIGDAFLTSEDINGNVIDSNKSYLVINVSIKNTLNKKISLTKDSYSLVINNQEISPSLNKDIEFVDLGNTFKNMDILANAENDFLLIFEISKNQINKEYILKIQEKYGDDKTIIVKPIILNSNNNIVEYNNSLPITVEFKDSILKNSSIIINSYEINDMFKEKYEKCNINDCYEAYNIIKPSIINDSQKSVLKLILSEENGFKIDDSVIMKNNLIYPYNLFEYYGKIEYRYLGNYNTIDLEPINSFSNLNYISYFSVPSQLKYADQIKLHIIIRGINYSILLK